MKKLFIAALALLAIAMVAVGCGGDKKAAFPCALSAVSPMKGPRNKGDR